MYLYNQNKQLVTYKRKSNKENITENRTCSRKGKRHTRKNCDSLIIKKRKKRGKWGMANYSKSEALPNGRKIKVRTRYSFSPSHSLKIPSIPPGPPLPPSITLPRLHPPNAKYWKVFKGPMNLLYSAPSVIRMDFSFPEGFVYFFGQRYSPFFPPVYVFVFVFRFPARVMRTSPLF